MIEHAADPKRFVATAASLVKPGGLLLVSTLNRTLRSFALAIVGAEYVLRWLEPERTLGAIRNPARAHRLRPRRGPEAPEAARHGLRSVPARLAPLVRYGRELSLRREEA